MHCDCSLFWYGISLYENLFVTSFYLPRLQQDIRKFTPDLLTNQNSFNKKFEPHRKSLFASCS